MDFLKPLLKHYEKVLLSVVLLVLAGAAVFLLLRVSDEQQELERLQSLDVRTGKKPVPIADLSTNEIVLRRIRRAEEIVLNGEHNLFNPVTWKKRPDGSLVKIVTGREIGPGAIKILKVVPLKLMVSYEGSMERGSSTSYRFKVTREAHKKPSSRSPVTREVMGVGNRNDIFTLREVHPSVEKPEEFVLEIEDDDDRTQVTVGKDQPYEGIAGYMMDLYYEPDKLQFLNRRVDDRLVFAGDTNRIVSMEADSVTMEALSNKKRTTITLESAAAAPASR